MMALGEHQAMVEQLALLTRTVGIEREANAAKKQFLRYVFHEVRRLAAACQTLASLPDDPIPLEAFFSCVCRFYPLH